MPTIIILHGWGHSSAYWSEMKKMLEKDFQVFAIDMPGFGDEPLVEDSWSIPDYANWVIEKLKKIPGDKVLLGHSFGGRVSSYIASGQPQWLRGLILDGSPSIYRPSFRTRFKIKIAKILKKLNIKGIFNSGNQELLHADKSGKGKIFRNVVSFDQTDLLPKINVSTLLIWGEKDYIVPLRIGREMQALIPKSELVVVDNAGHQVHTDNPFLFYGVTKKFVKGL